MRGWEVMRCGVYEAWFWSLIRIPPKKYGMGLEFERWRGMIPWGGVRQRG